MIRWWTYIKERFPLAVYALLVGGFCYSGFLVSGAPWDGIKFFLSALGLFLFFAELRLMDEFKDYKKDLVAHPERPLPRGLLKLEEVNRAINGLLVLMLALSFVLGPVYGFVTIYLWFMYKEFFLGEWLGNRQILYAVTHQVIILPICAFTVVIFDPSLVMAPQTWWLGVMILGSFFSYEVCRKLNPNAHPILKTYVSQYGVKGCLALVTVLSLVASIGACSMKLGPLLWGPEALVVLSFFILLKDPKKFKLVEGIATLSLLIHLWAKVVQHYSGWPV